MPQEQQLLDKDQVIEVINQLFIKTDRRDWTGVLACFTDNVRFDMSSMTGEPVAVVTAQSIVDGWDTGLKDLQATHHQIGNYLVNITDDAAMAFCYGITMHYLPNETNRNTRTFVGTYDVHLQRVGTAWKIDQLTFNLQFIDGNKDLVPAS